MKDLKVIRKEDGMYWVVDGEGKDIHGGFRSEDLAYEWINWMTDQVKKVT